MDDEKPIELETFYLARLLKGPLWTAASTPALEQLQQAHLAHNFSLIAAKKALLVGPAQDQTGDLRGLTLLRAESEEQARAWTEADPAVQAGRFRIELIKWSIPRGQIG